MCAFSCGITSISIPASVTEMESAFTESYALTEINVDSSNPNYMSKDGVLFNKDGKELICYPDQKTDIEYTVSDGVVAIKDGALVVCKLDRFARTAIEGVQTVRELFDRGVKVHILNMGLIENTLTGNLILTVMLAFAEYERGMIVERTQVGKALAKQNPNFRDGRPKKFTQEQIGLALGLLKDGKTYREVERMTGVSKSTMVRARKIYK